MSPIKVGLMAAVVSLAALAVTTSAQAKGCNGYVNQMQWGCAPWDNNNGPQYPHWQGGAQQRQQPQQAPQLQFQKNARAQVSNGTNLANQGVNHANGGVINAGGAN